MSAATNGNSKRVHGQSKVTMSWHFHKTPRGEKSGAGFFALEEKAQGASSPNLARFLRIVQNQFRDDGVVVVPRTSNSKPQTTNHNQ